MLAAEVVGVIQWLPAALVAQAAGVLEVPVAKRMELPEPPTPALVEVLVEAGLALQPQLVEMAALVLSF